MADTSVQVTQGSGTRLHTFNKSVGGQTVHEEVMLPGEYGLATYSAGQAGIGVASTGTHAFQLMAGSSLNLYLKRMEIRQVALAGAATITTLTLLRLTTAGTGGTSLAPQPYDTTDPSAGATFAHTVTTPGATGATLIRGIPLALASGAPTTIVPFIWDASLNRKAIRIPAGTSNGIALAVVSAVATATISVFLEFVEASY